MQLCQKFHDPATTTVVQNSSKDKKNFFIALFSYYPEYRDLETLKSWGWTSGAGRQRAVVHKGDLHEGGGR